MTLPPPILGPEPGPGDEFNFFMRDELAAQCVSLRRRAVAATPEDAAQIATEGHRLLAAFEVCRDEYPDQAEAIDPEQVFSGPIRDILGELAHRFGSARVTARPSPIAEQLPRATGPLGAPRPLAEVLDRLEDRALASFHDTAPLGWEERTKPALEGLVEFVRFVTRAPTHGRFVSLLRDCLLVHLAIRQLARRGAPVDSQPLILGRAYLGPYFPEYDDQGETAYGFLIDAFYRALRGATSPVDLRARLGEELSAWAGFSPLLEDLGVVATSLHDGESFTVLETGVHGTMPLLLSLASPLSSGFKLFTTFPWISEQYRGLVFSPQVERLRLVENVVCQEHLFFFDSIREGAPWVRPSMDEGVWRIAVAEVRALLQMMDEIP